MNTPQLNLAVQALPMTVVGRLQREHGTDIDAIAGELYLRTLSREPTTEELATVRDFASEAVWSGAAMEDLMWALLNSAEFAYRR
jgi:hypothetical protein